MIPNNPQETQGEEFGQQPMSSPNGDSQTPPLGRRLSEVMGERLNEAKSAFAGKMDQAAEALRQNAPREGALGGAATAVANKLHDAGNYLTETELKQMGKELSDSIAKHPIAAVVAGFGLGLLIGRPLFSGRRQS